MKVLLAEHKTLGAKREAEKGEENLPRQNSLAIACFGDILVDNLGSGGEWRDEMERRELKNRGIRLFPSYPACAFRSSPVPCFNFRALQSALGKPGEEVETVTPLRSLM